MKDITDATPFLESSIHSVHIVDTHTGEIIFLDGATLEDLAHQSRMLIQKNDQRSWEMSKNVAIARAICYEDETDVQQAEWQFNRWITNNFFRDWERVTLLYCHRRFEIWNMEASQ